MTQIAITRLGTSNDASLCKGFALFPALGTARAGVSVSNQSRSLIDTSTSLVIYRFSCRAGYQLFFGICGPAYGLAFDISGTTNDNTAEFALANSYAEAGFFVGASLRLYFNLSVQKYQLQWIYDGWNSRLEGQWNDALSVDFDITVDLIGITFEILQKVLSGKGPKLDKIANSLSGIADKLPSIQGTFGLVDTNRDGFAEDGKVELSPALDIPINFVSQVPALRAFVESLERLGGSLEAGPLISLAIPVEITLEDIYVGDKTYQPRPVSGSKPGDTQPAKDGDITADGTDAGVEASDNPRNIGVKLSHTAGFEIGIGYFVKISIFKIFEVNNQNKIPLLETLGITVKSDPRENTVSNTIGQKLAQGGIPGAGLPKEAYAAVEAAAQDAPEIRLKRVAFRPKNPVRVAA